jgi:hypothetical protein
VPIKKRLEEGTKVPNDGRAKVPVSLNPSGHTGVTGEQMPNMRPVFVPVTHIGSSASRLGGRGIEGRAAGMNHENIPQGETVEHGKGHFMLARAS